MKRLKKYIAGFNLALSRELIYRANFFIGRIRELILFATLLFLFQYASSGAAREALLSYALMSAFVSALILVYGMNTICFEIADGDLSNYLLRPVSYLWFWVWRMIASRTLLFVSGIVQVVLLALITHAKFFWQTNPNTIFSFFLLLFGALVLIQCIDFIGGLLAFWSHRSHGARWMITIFVQLLSGAYIPISLYPHWIQTLFFSLPFPSLIYFPVKAYLGQLTIQEVVRTCIVQWAWIGIFGSCVFIAWRFGVKHYEAYGR